MLTRNSDGTYTVDAETVLLTLSRHELEHTMAQALDAAMKLIMWPHLADEHTRDDFLHHIRDYLTGLEPLVGMVIDDQS